MDIEEARRRLAEHPPKGDPTNITFGETLDEKAARLDREPPVPSQHQPRRGDAVEVWLKAQRDQHAATATTQWSAWDTLDVLLDTYRLHADTRTPLGEHACEQHCDCDEAAGLSDGGPDA